MVALGPLEQGREDARCDHVVGVDEGQVGSPRVLHAEVARIAKPAVGLAEIGEVLMRVRELSRNVGAVVGRAVIDEDDLDRDPALARDGLEASGQVFGDVVDGNYNTDVHERSSRIWFL